MDIDAEIAAAMPPADAQPQADATPKVEEQPTPEEPAETETEATEPEEPAEQEKPEEFSKKARNALSYRDKKIGKLQAQLEAERQARMQLEQRMGTPKPAEQARPEGPPKESEYQTYAEYLEALQDYKLDQRLNAIKQEQQKTQNEAQEADWVAERTQAVEERTRELVKELPDAKAVIEEYADLLDDFSPQLQRLFLEADDGAKAFYHLAKEGKLEALMQMPISRAAMLIGQAEAKPVEKPKTKAPAPLPAARGSVAGEKQLTEMTPDELLKWVKS